MLRSLPIFEKAGKNKFKKVFQFRIQESKLDPVMIELTKTVHPQFVAGCRYHGSIGQSLHIYEMDHLPGTPYIMARNIALTQRPDSVSRQLITVRYLAKSASDLGTPHSAWLH
jgi:hypothetical protein